jgi:hypothetical protein
VKKHSEDYRTNKPQVTPGRDNPEREMNIVIVISLLKIKYLLQQKLLFQFLIIIQKHVNQTLFTWWTQVLVTRLGYGLFMSCTLKKILVGKILLTESNSCNCVQQFAIVCHFYEWPRVYSVQFVKISFSWSMNFNNFLPY